MRKGAHKDVGATAPLVPGYEIAGVIASVRPPRPPSVIPHTLMQIGPSVPANLFSVGDEVFGALRTPHALTVVRLIDAR